MQRPVTCDGENHRAKGMVTFCRNLVKKFKKIFKLF